MAHCVFLARRNSTNTLFSGENEKRNPAGVRILRQSEDSIQCSELELEFGFGIGVGIYAKTISCRRRGDYKPIFTEPKSLYLLRLRLSEYRLVITLPIVNYWNAYQFYISI